MAGAAHDDAAASIDPLRPKLIRVAYRMLGSVDDAEDMVQEPFIRWMGPSCAVRSPGSASISSNQRAASVRPMSAPGFPIRWLTSRRRKTSPCL